MSMNHVTLFYNHVTQPESDICTLPICNILFGESFLICQIGETDTGNINIFQSSIYDERNGRRACFPLINTDFPEHFTASLI
jgi:hypothetical protein